jgi:hypothetical protein
MNREGDCRRSHQRTRGRLLIFSVLLLLYSATATAALAGAPALAADRPQPYSVIVGTVWTAENRPAAGIVVKIRRADKRKAQWELRSDARGEFVQHLPAESADYIVWAEVKGHKGPVAETKVHIENDERQDIGLHLSD